MRSSIGAIELNYLVDGDCDLPWLIFSNSVATDTGLWDGQINFLKGHFRILRYDQRGHGLSDVPIGRYTIDMVADDLYSLMQSLQISRASLIGISMGGMTVLTLAKRHPELVDKLVVCDCGPAANASSTEQWLERIDVVSAEGMSAIVDETINRWFTEQTLKSHSPVIKRVAKMVRSTPREGFIGSAYALSTFDLRPGLEDMNVPTLFMAGQHDAALEGTRALSNSVPGSKFAIVPSAGHLCNLENPQGFITTLKTFLESPRQLHEIRSAN